jgi:hypothetical protein
MVIAKFMISRKLSNIYKVIHVVLNKFTLMLEDFLTETPKHVALLNVINLCP